MNERIPIPGTETSHVAVNLHGRVGICCILVYLDYHIMLEEKTFVCGDMAKTMTRIKTGCCCWIQSKVQTSSAYWYHLASEFQVSGTVMHCTKRCLADKVFAHDHCNHDRQTHFGKWTYCEFMYCGLKMWNAFPVGTVSYLEYVIMIMCLFWAIATEHQYIHVFNAKHMHFTRFSLLLGCQHESKQFKNQAKVDSFPKFTDVYGGNLFTDPTNVSTNWYRLVIKN
jgi:hypothetical protein